MLAVLSRRNVITAAMLGLASYFGLSSVSTSAEGMKPIQNPITGNEDLGDLSQPQQALAQFYRAFNTRDIKMIDENFAHSDEVAIDNPLGGIRRGADEPHKMYEGVFKSPADVHVEFWDYTIHRAGDVFWAVGRERGTDGKEVIEDAKLLGDYQGAVQSGSAKTQ
jgi:limonene-1,2-epoxide hydrolase